MQFGGVVAVNNMNLEVRRGGDRLPDRPQRRGQDHGLQRHHRRVPAHQRRGVVPGGEDRGKLPPGQDAQALQGRARRGVHPRPGPHPGQDHPDGHGPDLPEYPSLEGPDGVRQRADGHALPCDVQSPHCDLPSEPAGGGAAAPAGGRAAGGGEPQRRFRGERRTPCPTASSGGWRSPGPWPRIRSCCCWTNRLRA